MVEKRLERMKKTLIFTICAALAAGMALATQPNAVLQKAQEGDAASQNAVGEWCYNGTNGMKRDYGQALQWWAKAAKQGDVKAVGNMGMCYRYGYGIDRDSLKATRLYLKSIRDGNDSLMTAVEAAAQRGGLFDGIVTALAYKTGNGVKRDGAKAVQYFQMAAEGGSVDAQREYALICLNTGRQSDALEWFAKAAEQGDLSATYFCGMMKMKGLGGEENHVEGLEFIEKAASRNFPQACYDLSLRYAAGDGVEMNRFYLEQLSTHPDLMSPEVLDVLRELSEVATLAIVSNGAQKVQTRRLAESFGNIQKSLAAADRVFAILDEKSEIQDKDGAKPIEVTEGLVEARHVAFAYEKENPVLTDLNFVARPGQTIAVVGPSGAGKTTIANLLPRFYDVTGGAICIDGVDIRDVTVGSLRDNIGLVPQDTLLFNTTIKENVLYGRLDATDEEVWDAIRAANAEKFIQGLPRGIDTKVGDRGLVLSGGQRQRIAIARAILKNPKILILDEATSALDTESEKIVQDALDKLMVGRTSFVIAHRLSTIKNADQILVLNHGVIEESGTHKELMEKKGLYHELYTMSQKNNREKNSD